MDSVFVPYMTLTYVVSGKVVDKFKSDRCDVINSTIMVCPSPSLVSLNLGQPRTRRESVKAPYEEFYIGFVLDGVTRYENLSQALPTQGTVDVFRDPLVERFPGDVVDFKVYESQTIVIKVTC